MSPWWVVVLCALVMGAVGHLTGRELATGGYRIREDEAEHPTGRPWWPGLATGALAALAAAAVGDLAHWAALPAFLLFAWLTVGLVWIDLDVHRLPVGLVVPTGGALLVLLAVASLASGDSRWLGGVVGAVVMGGFYLLLGLLPGGGVGGGDIRLAPVIGALLGWLSLGHLFVGMAAGFLIGGVTAVVLLLGRRVGLKSSIAYGPAMCLGAWVAVGATSRIATALVGG
ncbi:prepilin peptidase [Phycicoccus duodecadis]|uniref:Leader peptidase (Prepilin peptidase)/N-methyltransferase n=1 Tax=Phycicoccus duodecadis TaxID=173053 RepID=A0A2N3YN95_9MICO|nr:prepilin peptidase [Phycicoccus duodecadis]PKW28332.1 leader peptidase (prepilin peptidase)/N-methyltransferase [Phycicoccus duodecadis]